MTTSLSGARTRIGMLAGLAAGCALIAPASAANVLLDSSFSASTFPDNSAAWTLDDDYLVSSGCGERGAQIQNSSFANNPGGDPGTDAGVWFKSFASAAPGCADIGITAAVSQTAAVVGGSAYSLEGAFKIEEFFTAGDFLFGVQYFDAAMTIINSTALDLLSAVSNDGDWHDVSLATVAPVNAAFATVIIRMTDGALNASNPQSAFADDIKLLGDAPDVSDVPLPAALPLFLAGLAGLQLSRRRAKARRA